MRHYWAFMDFADIWVEQMQERIINTVLWYWTNFGLFSLAITLLLAIGIVNLALHFIDHRKLKQEAYHRGYKKGRKEK